ncbi:hypothetical protein OYT1_ch0176 [Ferriphaselus amnicola]|uniref:Uncharacterized protein n=1 Tax=Ferriphaselus amnicola TaxID=1188319 RepID=A0A2Z6G8F4_9PROT|nr:hypothetical protein OYT1_ch0176 [Ferriphaselus amnicola]
MEMSKFETWGGVLSQPRNTASSFAGFSCHPSLANGAGKSMLVFGDGFALRISALIDALSNNFGLEISYGKHDRRGVISNRKFFEARSPIVEGRSRIGDRGCTIICKNHNRPSSVWSHASQTTSLIRKVNHETVRAARKAVIKNVEDLPIQRIRTSTT